MDQQRFYTGAGALGRTLRDLIGSQNKWATLAEIEECISNGNVMEYPHFYQLFPSLGITVLLPEANLLERHQAVSKILNPNYVHACYRDDRNVAQDIIYSKISGVYCCCVRNINSWNIYCDGLAANGN